MKNLLDRIKKRVVIWAALHVPAAVLYRVAFRLFGFAEFADHLQKRGPRGPEIDPECPPLELPRQPFPWEDEAFQLESESRTRSVSLPSETVKQAGEWNETEANKHGI